MRLSTRLSRRNWIAAIAGGIGIVVITTLVVVLLVARSGANHVSEPGNLAPGATAAPLTTPGKAIVYVFTAGTVNITNPTKVIQELRAASFQPDGIDWVIPWSTLEPSPGEYDWGVVDGDLNAAAKAGYRSFIEIIPGVSDPGWALAECPTVQVGLAGGTRSGSMCVPTSPEFLQLWTQMIAAFGARYDGRAGLTMVQASGCGALGEMQLPVHDLSTWSQAGVTTQTLLTAWEQVIDAWRAALPRTPSSLAIDEPFGPGGSDVLQPLLDYVHQRYGSNVWVQQNGLRPGWLSKAISYREELEASQAWTRVGWQLAGTASKYGSLATSLSEGQAIKPTFYEVYLADILSAVNAPTLGAARSGLG